MRALLGIILSLACLSTVHAQDKGVFFSFSAGTGVHSLNYDLTDGQRQADNGVLFEASAGYLLTPQWGIQTGLGIITGQTTSSLNLMTASSQIDADKDAYELRTYYKNWTERQAMTFLTIPLNLLLRTPSKGRFHLNASLGTELMLPIQSTYEVCSGEIVTAGYYSLWDVEITNAPRHGWLTVTDRFKGHNSLNPCLMLTESLSGSYRFSNSMEGYLGAYLHYGINNAIDPQEVELYSNGQYNSLLGSSRVNWTSPFLIGIKIGVNFYFRPKSIGI
jgi:hypothetical protein